MKTHLAGLLAFIFCFSCGHEKSGSPGEGNGQFGGLVRLNEIENFKSLFPVSINELPNYHIATQVYEGLVRYDEELNLIPALARAWDMSKDLKEYTFHLREGVFFHDDACFPDSAGRTVTAADVKYCFENLCSKGSHNSQFEITFRDRVEGANEYYESGTGHKQGLSGVEIKDDSTLVIRLTQPDANFLNVLAMPGCFIYPKEAYQKYGAGMRAHCVGTGPFFIAYLNEGIEIIMKKNPRYWGLDSKGNQLPYLDSLRWTFIMDKKTEIEEFRNHRLDMIYRIPVDMFPEVLDTSGKKKKNLPFELYSSPALSTNYYGFNLQANPFFSFREIRLAFNLAIDRKVIAEQIIKGEGQAAVYGVVPYTETFERKGYDYKSLKGFKYDPDSARRLLASVGYDKGKGLPPFNLEINGGGGEKNLMVAVGIQKMLQENLGIKVNLSIVTWPEHMENVQTGKVDFFRYAFISDYADPESFLSLFYGKHVPDNYLERSYVNLVRFKNSEFDSLFMAAKAEPDQRKRYKLFSMAEQVVLNEAAFMPLFYDENLRLVQKNVRNLKENAINYVDLRTTYLSKDK